MPPILGRCALCLQEKPLLGSHFIPAAIYKNLIDPAGAIKNMIASNLTIASEESKQIKQPLLCQDCEIRFQQGGETWVLGRRLMPNGTFVLRDLLRQATPAGTRDGAAFFTLNGSANIDHEQLLYFAASVFWRAAVTDWETPLGHYSRISVDTSVAEDLREYLLGGEPFPALASIIAIVSAADHPADLTTLPAAAPEAVGYQQFDWIMPGMGFTFLTGEGVPEGMRAISLSQDPYCIAISPRFDDRIRAAGIQHAQRSVATEKLQKKLDQA